VFSKKQYGIINKISLISADPGSSGLWMGKSKKGQLVNIDKGYIIGRCLFLLLEFYLFLRNNTYMKM